MVRCVVLLACAFSAVAAEADAASRNCLRGGAKLLAAGERAQIVRIRERPRNDETRRDRVLGCWAPTGRRFTMFVASEFGADLQERDRVQVIGGRYGGAVRHFVSGVAEGSSASVWDIRTRRRLHDASGCEDEPGALSSGAAEAVFLPRGGVAYRCFDGQVRVADRDGDRQVEPAGNKARELAVATNEITGTTRLYWLVTTESGSFAKSLVLDG